MLNIPYSTPSSTSYTGNPKGGIFLQFATVQSLYREKRAGLGCSARQTPRFTHRHFENSKPTGAGVLRCGGAIDSRCRIRSFCNSYHGDQTTVGGKKRWIGPEYDKLGRYNYFKVQMCDIRQVQSRLQYSDKRKRESSDSWENVKQRDTIFEIKSLFPTPETHL